jgi:prophage regulatory protein
MERLLGQKAVRDMVGFSFAHIARLEKAGSFPKRIRIGGRVFWLLSEIQAWIRFHTERRNTADTGS